MPKTHLTDIVVRNLKAPATGQITYWAEQPSGFGVRVSTGGTKTFILVHGRNRQRLTIGRYPAITLAQANAEAKRLLAEATLGKSLARSVIFETALAKFLETARKRNKPRTVRDYERLLNRHFLPSLRKYQIGEIGAKDILKRLDRLKDTPSEQQHALAAIRAFFNFAISQHMLSQSPCAGFRPMTRPSARDRVLDDWELSLVWNAAFRTPYPFGPIVRLLILTGQRRGEIAALKWDWIDERAQTMTLPASLTKNKRQHIVPYGESTAALLASLPRLGPQLFPARTGTASETTAAIFNGWGKCKARLDAAILKANGDTPLAPWTLHDLRRTFTTHLASVKTPPHVAEKLINHATGTISGVAAIYNRFQYMEEMRDAVHRWEAKLIVIASPAGQNTG